MHTSNVEHMVIFDKEMFTFSLILYHCFSGKASFTYRLVNAHVHVA